MNLNNIDYNQNNNQNINQIPVSNSEKPEAENRKLMRKLTITVLILTIIVKICSFGLSTFILTMSFILPLYFIVFTIVGLRLADIRNKDKKDYIYFAILCITIFLWSFSFVDCDSNGNEYYGPMEFINKDFRSNINKFSLIANIIFLIISFYRCYKKKIAFIKQEKMKMNENDRNIEKNITGFENKVTMIVIIIGLILSIVGILILS